MSRFTLALLIFLSGTQVPAQEWRLYTADAILDAESVVEIVFHAEGIEVFSRLAGAVDIELEHRDELCQQHGLFHGGVVGTLADNAGGYASFSLMRAEDSVLTVEYKLNLMAPAQGDRLIARGRVVRAGRRLTVSRSDVYATAGDRETHCATMLGTFMTMQDVSDSRLETASG